MRDRIHAHARSHVHACIHASQELAQNGTALVYEAAPLAVTRGDSFRDEIHDVERLLGDSHVKAAPGRVSQVISREASRSECNGSGDSPLHA